MQMRLILGFLCWKLKGLLKFDVKLLEMLFIFLIFTQNIEFRLKDCVKNLKMFKTIRRVTILAPTGVRNLSLSAATLEKIGK